MTITRSTLGPSARFAMALGLLAFLVLLVPSIAAAQETADPQFLAYMEQIAEDMEEIHHDMHKVSFALRLSSYALVAIALLLAVQTVLKVTQTKRD